MTPVADCAFRSSARSAITTLTIALAVTAGGCGRRGPPLPPLQVDPEAPRLLPLRQEDGRVVVRWYAPRLSSRGDVEDLRLRKAIVSYRLVDIHGLAADERAFRRAEAAEPDVEASEAPEPDPLETESVEEASPDSGTGPGGPQVEPGEPEAGAAEPAEPEGGLTEPEVGPGEPPAEPADAPLPNPSVPEAPPGASPGAVVPPEQEPAGEAEVLEEPHAAEPGEGDAPGEEAGEPEVTGRLLDYDDLEFEVLSEVESEILGEERVLELPVEQDWIGQRLEIRVRYEARGGSSEASEPQSLDVTPPLPAVEGVSVDVGSRELTIRWQDPWAGSAAMPLLADPTFEVFRRRGADSEGLGRSRGQTRTDSDVVWGEEVCYRARIVMAGSDAERVLPDPGLPVSETSDPGGEAPGSPDPTEGMADSTTPDEPEPVGEAQNPIPIRVPGAGSGALSVGPMSAEACVTPVDVFPPLPPSDLRLFWRAEATELSWKESVSSDVAGYHVYRSGPDGAGFERLTESPVSETSFRDVARDPRGRYRYAVTAVDGADPPNEGLPSESSRVNPR